MYRGVSTHGKAFVYANVAAAGGKSARLTALIDTGATVTGVSQSIVRELEMSSINNRKLSVKTASGNAEMKVYRATIRLLGNNNVRSGEHDIKIVGLPFAWREFDMILGMDVLSRCCFISRGREFFLGFDTDGEKTLQAAKDFLAPKRRGAGK